MIKYKIIRENVLNIGQDDIIIIVEQPYEFISRIFIGNERSSHIQKLIDSIEKVLHSELDSYYFANESGFEADAHKPDLTNFSFSKGFVHIYDTFGNKEPLLTIPLIEILNLLKDFKKYLEDNDR